MLLKRQSDVRDELKASRLCCTITGTYMHLFVGISNKMFFGCVFLTEQNQEESIFQKSKVLWEATLPQCTELLFS